MTGSSARHGQQGQGYNRIRRLIYLLTAAAILMLTGYCIVASNLFGILRHGWTSDLAISYEQLPKKEQDDLTKAVNVALSGAVGKKAEEIGKVLTDVRERQLFDYVDKLWRETNGDLPMPDYLSVSIVVLFPNDGVLVDTQYVTGKTHRLHYRRIVCDVSDPIAFVCIVEIGGDKIQSKDQCVRYSAKKWSKAGER